MNIATIAIVTVLRAQSADMMNTFDPCNGCPTGYQCYELMEGVCDLGTYAVPADMGEDIFQDVLQGCIDCEEEPCVAWIWFNGPCPIVPVIPYYPREWLCIPDSITGCGPDDVGGYGMDCLTLNDCL